MMLETKEWLVCDKGIFYLGLFQLKEANFQPATYWSDQLLPFKCIGRKSGLNRWLRVRGNSDLEMIDPERGLIFPLNPDSIKKVDNWGKCLVSGEGIILPYPYNYTPRQPLRINPNMVRKPVTSAVLTVVRIDLTSQETVIVDWRARALIRDFRAF